MCGVFYVGVYEMERSFAAEGGLRVLPFCHYIDSAGDEVVIGYLCT